MSSANSKTRKGSRSTKRARFAQDKAASRSGGFPPLAIAIVAVLVIAGALAWILTGPSRGREELRQESVVALGPVSANAGSQPQVEKVTAATFGHDPYPLVTATDGAVRLPLATFDDYKAHYYTYSHDGQSIEFFVLQSRDGIVRAAFNACDVCFAAKRGYSQDGDVMVCNNCGSRFPADQINVQRGGCNPAPLDRVVEGDELVILVADIIAGLGYF